MNKNITKDPGQPWIAVRWDDYYPSGGLSNCQGRFDTLIEAARFLVKEQKRIRCDYAEVYHLSDLWDPVWDTDQTLAEAKELSKLWENAPN